MSELQEFQPGMRVQLTDEGVRRRLLTKTTTGVVVRVSRTGLVVVKPDGYKSEFSVPQLPREQVERAEDALARWLGAEDLSAEGQAAVAWHVAHTHEAAEAALSAVLTPRPHVRCGGSGELVSFDGKAKRPCPNPACIEGFEWVLTRDSGAGE